jgi:plasmid stability protein
MPNLLIRNISNEILDRLKSIAKRHRRSLQQELHEVLESATEQSFEGTIQKAEDLKERLRRKSMHFTDSVRLLREDRKR